jgi:hypothetical protein
MTPALQIGDRIRKRGMSTFVPGDRVCTSGCALIWLAGMPRLVGDTPQIGFHAAYDPSTRLETGSGNAVVGAYLRDLGIDYKAIVFMTRQGPTKFEWLTPELAKELGVAWETLEPARTIPMPPQPKLQHPLDVPPEIIAAWSQSAKFHAETKRKLAEAEQQRLAAALRAEQLFETRPSTEAQPKPLSPVTFKLGSYRWMSAVKNAQNRLAVTSSLLARLVTSVTRIRLLNSCRMRVLTQVFATLPNPPPCGRKLKMSNRPNLRECSPT